MNLLRRVILFETIFYSLIFLKYNTCSTGAFQALLALRVSTTPCTRDDRTYRLRVLSKILLGKNTTNTVAEAFNVLMSHFYLVRSVTIGFNAFVTQVCN
jgi:hypothetical protein